MLAKWIDAGWGYLLVAVLGLMVGGLYAGSLQGWRYEARLDALRAEQATQRATAAQAQTQAVSDARLEERRRTAAQTEKVNDAMQQLDAARGDAATARDATDRLREQLARYVAASRAAGHPSPAGASPPAGGTGDLPADLFLESVERARALAAAADDARIAGLACEGSYDALTPPQP